MTIDEIAVKISALLQRSNDEPFLSVLPAYILQAQQIIKDAGVKDTVADSEKAVGAIARGVLDLWNFGAGEGRFSQSFFQMVEQLKYNDGINGKLILNIESAANSFRFIYTDGTTSEWFMCLQGERGEQGLQGPKGDTGEQGPQGLPGADGKDGTDYTLTQQDKTDIAQLATAGIKPIVKTTLDDTLTVNTEYYLREQTEVNLVYPQTANLGDCIYVNFISSETAATVISQNCIGLDSFVPNANSICEIHAQYNGQWVCLTSQTEVNV